MEQHEQRDAAESLRAQYDSSDAKRRLEKDAKRAEFLERALRLSQERPE